MSTYEFRFLSRAALERAFSNLMSCEYVEDCQVFLSALSLRFRAHDGPATEELFKQIQREASIVPSNTIPPG